MGEAILSAVLDGKLATTGDVWVSDVIKARLDYLKNKYGIGVTADNREAVEARDIVVLAVKPQSLPAVMEGLKDRLDSNTLVLSIVAGVKIDTIARGLGHECIVRCMPNTPAKIGYGMSAWTATAEVSEEQEAQARAVLGGMGREIYFKDEEYLDAVTAVSGSGPAYVFLFAEAMMDAAVKIGLSPEEAAEMVSQTVLGAAHLMEESPESPAELIRNVASKGGTTARALEVFEKGGLAGLVEDAVKAAYQRSKELGGG